MKQLRLLVVDDNQDAANTVATLLRALGHDAVQAYDANGALALVHSHRPQVVFLDLVMPSLDGLSLGKRIRAVPGFEGVALIALTAFAQPAFQDLTRGAGFDAHLLKPARPDELQQVLRRYM